MRRRTVVLAVLALASAGAVGVALWPRIAPRVPVEVAMVESGVVSEYVGEQGRTRLPTTHLVTMPFEGRIGVISIEEGTPVRKGEVVAELVAEDLRLPIEAAEAVVGRLAASIRENSDKGMELTALRQTESLRESISRTVETADQQRRSAEARLEYAERELNRTRTLVEREAATPKELNERETELVEAEVAMRQSDLVRRATESLRAVVSLLPPMVEQYMARKELRGGVLAQELVEARVRLAEARLRQARGRLVSPVDGVVLARPSGTSERLVAAGATLLEIGSLQDLEVEADVLSEDALRLKPGMFAEFLDPAGERRIGTGTVRRIFPAGFTKESSLGIEQQRVKCLLEFDEATRAQMQYGPAPGVGYELRVRILTAESARALRIPRSAVFRGEDSEWRVYRVESGRARLRTISTGLSNDLWVEVVGGLEARDRVVLGPDARVEDGRAVAVRNRPE